MGQKGNINRYLSVLAIILLTALAFGMTEGQANRNQGSVSGVLVELAAGYDGFQNVAVQGEPDTAQKRLLPSMGEQGVYVLAEWDFEADIDLCVYNEQNERCIGTISLLSDNDGFLYCDNDGSKGYELAYLEDYEEGVYTVYLKDCDVISENPDADAQTKSITVSIYAADGLLYQKEIQMEGDAGLVKCAYICRGEVEGQNECIRDLTDYAWAARNKREPLSWAKETNVERAEEYRFKRNGDFPLWWIRVYEYNGEGSLAAQIEYKSTEYSSTDDEEGGFPLPFPMYQHNGHEKEGGLTEKFIYRPIEAYENEYDEYGNRKKLCSYGPEGQECICRYEYQYDENGRVLLRELYDSYDYGDEGIYEFLSEREKYEYDEYGNVTAHYYEENKDGIWALFGAYEYEYEYDENGRVITYRQLDGWTLEYHYDAEGNQKDCYRYASDGSLVDYTEYKYDAHGVLRRRCDYLRNGELDSEQEYDEMGNLSATYAYAFYGGTRHLNERYEYQFDANAGMAVAYQYDREDVLISEKVTIYHP